MPNTPSDQPRRPSESAETRVALPADNGDGAAQPSEALPDADTRLTVVPTDDVGITVVGEKLPLPGRSYNTRQILPSGPRYTRSSLHASGGMGSVWLARDSHFGRDVALKELRENVAEIGSVSLRFLREAQITGQLEHPGVVPVYELGCDPATGRPYYTMRFVRGRTLAEAAREFHARRQAGEDDPLDFVKLLDAFVSVCNTIAYAHSHDIVHRDLKGENIILGDFGEVIVLDWGLAKQLSDDEDDLVDGGGTVRLDPMISPSSSQTLLGEVMGTPAYMAPEQAQGRQDLVGTWTDIFGAGAILYEILTGRPPFSSASTTEILKQAASAEIVPPSVYWPTVPADLEAICLKATSQAPRDRHPSAKILGREVQGWQDKQRRQAELQLRRAGDRLMQQQRVLVTLTRSEVFAEPDLLKRFYRFIEASARTLGVERVSVWRYTEDRQAIRCHLLYELSTGQTTAGIELGKEAFPDYFAALQTSEVIAAHDARLDPRTSEFTESYLNPLNIGAIMDAPIHIDGEMCGVVCHEHVGGSRTWTPDEQLFAIAIANLVSQAISQAGE